jgi:hypothetical protein
VETEPLASELLAFRRPSEWEELLDRFSLAGIEGVLRSALRRRSNACYLLAWQTANLMNATGNFPEDHAVDPRRLFESLGPFWHDPRVPVSDESPYLIEDEDEAFEDAEARAMAMESAGFARRGRLTPEELAREQATESR